MTTFNQVKLKNTERDSQNRNNNNYYPFFKLSSFKFISGTRVEYCNTVLNFFLDFFVFVNDIDSVFWHQYTVDFFPIVKK